MEPTWSLTTFLAEDALELYTCYRCDKRCTATAEPFAKPEVSAIDQCPIKAAERAAAEAEEKARQETEKNNADVAA